MTDADQVHLTQSSGNPILDWRTWSPPKKPEHWRAGRSAMELARAWFRSPVPRCPEEVLTLLQSVPHLKALRIESGVPELVTRLPEPGEGRNHDIALQGLADGEKVFVGVEAKADESFGERIGAYWSKARRSREGASGSPSNAPERIEKLLSLLAGESARPDTEPWSEIRYQLLTAAVGTLLEASARSCKIAVLVIHEFRTTETLRDKLDHNHADYARFVQSLGLAKEGSATHGVLYGPYSPPAMPVSLFVGKAVYDWAHV